jgi:TatD DNase family protein
MQKLQLVDTHCHLYAEEFQGEKIEAITRAELAGVYKIFMPNIDLSSMDAMFELETDYPDICVAMMGLHPCYVKDDVAQQLEVVRDWINVRRFSAIGEIGLDFYWDLSFKEQQYEAFRLQLQWAMEKDLPVAIHSRESLRDCIDEVRRVGNGRIRGIFHCFGGTVADANEIMDMGMYLGIGGVVTFKKSGLAEVIQDIGLNRVVLETDAPYLAPVPFRGKRNEPAYVRYVAEKLSELTGKTLEEVGRITTANAEDVFGQ